MSEAELVYLIEMPLELPDRWYTVAICLEIEFAANVVGMLLAHNRTTGKIIRVRVGTPSGEGLVPF